LWTDTNYFGIFSNSLSARDNKWEGLMTVWFATGNIHKKQELAAILAGGAPGTALIIPGDEGIAFDPGETGATFLENALIKARALYRLTAPLAAERGKAGQGIRRIPVIADDSGLCVDALEGRPGILSARYGGEGRRKLEAAERNALLLKELGNAQDRRARFVCAMVLLWDENRFFAVQETLEGEIVPDVDAAAGSGGFGYDPILFIPGPVLGREQGCTAAELSDEEKNRVSHRGKAGRAVARILAGV
jgi:XTP/dITP diphosphohydrolase